MVKEKFGYNKAVGLQPDLVVKRRSAKPNEPTVVQLETGDADALAKRHFLMVLGQFIDLIEQNGGTPIYVTMGGLRSWTEAFPDCCNILKRRRAGTSARGAGARCSGRCGRISWRQARSLYRIWGALDDWARSFWLNLSKQKRFRHGLPEDRRASTLL